MCLSSHGFESYKGGRDLSLFESGHKFFLILMSYEMLTFFIVVDRVSSGAAESQNRQTQDSVAGATEGLNSTVHPPLQFFHLILGLFNLVNIWTKATSEESSLGGKDCILLS